MSTLYQSLTKLPKKTTKKTLFKCLFYIVSVLVIGGAGYSSGVGIISRFGKSGSFSSEDNSSASGI